MVSMRGRRALVTGGAGGIGRATAQALADRGADIAILDRDAEALAEAATQLSAYPIGCDVLDEGSVANAVEAAAERLGGACDVLVNAAGIYRIAALVELGVEEWDAVLGINLRGSWLVAREVARRLIESDSPGSIVNISSTAGLVADASEPAAHYNASKAGVIALTKQMAVEWAPYQIRVNAVCPGVIDTSMLRLMDDPIAGQRYVDQSVPMRRLGRPEEVAAVIAFLASDQASYVTGVAVPIDGGVTAI